MRESLSRSDYLFVRDLLHQRAGHELGEGKEYLVESRLSVLAESRGFSGPAAMLDWLRRFREKPLEDSLIDSMMTGETSFFRNPALFERLADTILPRLIKARPLRRLRFWCAGCSSGQEPYSIAILILERFPELASWDLAIVATDISESALTVARDGSYNHAEIRRGLTHRQIHDYFRPEGSRWKICDTVRKMVRLERVNLIHQLPYHSEFDLVFCRNVLIYFDLDIKRKVFQSLRRALVDDGYLFLGDSETILGVSQEFLLAEGELDCFRPAPGLNY